MIKSRPIDFIKQNYKQMQKIYFLFLCDLNIWLYIDEWYLYIFSAGSHFNFIVTIE